MELDPETTLSHADRSLGDCLDHTPPSDPPSPDASTGDGASPSRRALEDALACLDDGASAVACSSGAAALRTVGHAFDDTPHLLCAHDCGEETRETLSRLQEEGTLSVSYEDVTDREALTDAVRPDTAALWVESPSSTCLRAYDLETLSAFANANDLLLIVDNTVLSPMLQRPIEHGADLVVYTSTHHLAGQSDVDGGAVVARTPKQAATLTMTAHEHETTASAFNSWLLLRDIKTLPARIQQHETNARSLAYDLNEHPAVERVFYPGLRDHPSHPTARRQQDGYGHVASFVVDEEAVNVDTLAQEPSLFTNADGPGGAQSRISVSDASPSSSASSTVLVRLSIGTESTENLTDDLAQAFEAARIDDPGTIDDSDAERTREPVPVTSHSSESRRSSTPVR